MAEPGECLADGTCVTCDGRCCSLFTYSTPLEKIEERYTAPEPPDWYADEHATEDRKLIDMLIPVTSEEAKDRAERYGVAGRYKRALDEDYDQQYYKCRHWDEETMLCTDWANRPKMCAAYPYGDTCSHGCNYSMDLEDLVGLGYLKPEQYIARGYF